MGEVMDETRTIFTIEPEREIAFHPIAELIGPVSPIALRRLRERIIEQGMQTEICLYKGKILDGRHRYLACWDANHDPDREGEKKIECRAYEYTGDSPYEYALALNMRDRNLMHSARAVYGVQMSAGLIAEAKKRQLAGLKRGADSPLLDTSNNGESGKTAAHLARLVSVSESLIDHALALASKYPAHWAKVVSGELTVGHADDLAHGRDPTRRKHHRKDETPTDVTLAPVPAWEVPKPDTRNVVDWQRAFHSQAERARALHDQIATERQRRIHAEGSIPDKARALALKDIGAIKQQAADDIALMRRRCILAAAYIAGTVKMSPRLAQETRMNPQQWQEFITNYRDEMSGVVGARETTTGS